MLLSIKDQNSPTSASCKRDKQQQTLHTMGEKQPEASFFLQNPDTSECVKKELPYIIVESCR